jgi:hypothetical protein
VPNTPGIKLLTSAQLIAVADITRRQLQQLEVTGALVPYGGRRGKGSDSRWTVPDAVGAAYSRAFLLAGCTAWWAGAACAWVARQDESKVWADLYAGRTLLALTPDGHGRLVAPSFNPARTRETRIKVAMLNLRAVYERTLKRLAELCGELVDQEELS